MQIFGKNENKTMPVKSFRAGPIQATIWRNPARNKEGKEIEFTTVSFERQYRDKEGNWKTTHSLRINDLPKASLVLRKAYEFLSMKEVLEL